MLLSSSLGGRPATNTLDVIPGVSAKRVDSPQLSALPLRGMVRSHSSTVSPENTKTPQAYSEEPHLEAASPTRPFEPNKLDVFVAGLNYGGLYLDCIMPNISFRERSCGYFSPLSLSPQSNLPHASGMRTHGKRRCRPRAMFATFLFSG